MSSTCVRERRAVRVLSVPGRWTIVDGADPSFDGPISPWTEVESSPAGRQADTAERLASLRARVAAMALPWYEDTPEQIAAHAADTEAFREARARAIAPNDSL